MAVSLDPQPRAVPDTSTPVIDLGPYFVGMPRALEGTAALRYALEEIGFFIIINHGVAQALIDRTFAEAKRFHEQPMDAKMALRMNEHNNGYMAMGQYAVWTSDVNKNDKPDLNEAFFVKREGRLDDPLLRSGRRLVGPNQWPDRVPGFRETILGYIEAVDALGRRVLPVCAVALDLSPDYFDNMFADSQSSFRLSHYPPVQAKVNQFGIAPHTDANFLTFLTRQWARTDMPSHFSWAHRSTP
jgi:isopenicillin N synthase-like dioxygenase